MNNNISVNKFSCCYPCTLAFEAAKTVVNYIVTKVDNAAACILRNGFYYNPICNSKGQEIDLIYRSIQELDIATDLHGLHSLQRLFPHPTYVNPSKPADIDAAIQEKTSQLSTALKAHYYTTLGVLKGVSHDRNLSRLKFELIDLYRAKNEEINKQSSSDHPMWNSEKPQDDLSSVLVPKAVVTPEESRVSTETTRQDLVPGSEERSRQIELLTNTVNELDALGLNATGLDDLTFLHRLIPGYRYPTELFQIPDDVEKAITEKKAQLSTALKTHQFVVNGIWKPVDDKLELSIMKSDLARFYDIKRIRKNPGIRPKTQTILPLTPNVAKAEWPKPGQPLQHFPPHIFYFPHAVSGSDEPNNWRRDRETEKILYNIKSPWAIALEHIEKEYLGKPMKNMSVDELKKMILDIHQKLSGNEMDSFRDQELIVFKTGESMTFADYSELVKESDPDTSKSAMEMYKMGFRWGRFEVLRNYFETKHWQTMSKMGYVTPAPEDLERLLDEFLTKLKEILQSDAFHPYQVAAFIHYGMTGIHCYGDHNGRLARVLKNIYLMQLGLQPLTVLSDRAYTKAAQAPSDQFEKDFTDYLHQSSKKTEEEIAKGNLPTVKEPGEWTVTGHPLIDCITQ